MARSPEPPSFDRSDLPYFAALQRRDHSRSEILLNRHDDLPGRENRSIPEKGRDEIFLEGLLQNDRETMSQLYDIYGGAAYGLARRTLGAVGDAEDVVQEAFLALWRQAPQLDPSRGIKSYL